MKKQKDPVCGMEVDSAKALKAEHNHKQYSFCGQRCKDTFTQHPEKYSK